jgi:hypothetical protein
VSNTIYAKATLTLGTACLALAGAAQAQQLIPQGSEEFKLNLGGIVNSNSTSLRLDGSTARGTDVDLEGTTGLSDGGVSSFLASGTWRFAPNHRLSGIFFTADRDASRAVDRTITIGDTVIPINTNLKTEAKSQFFILNYEYSFMKTPDMELAAVLGLYGANFKYKFTASSPIVNIDKSTTAPLPVIGLHADFFINPRWTVSVLAEGLKLKVGDVDGSIYNVALTTDYMFARNWGVGMGYSVADAKVDVNSGSFNGHVGWRMDGYNAYVQMRF